MAKKKYKEKYCDTYEIWGKYQKSLDYLRIKGVKTRTDQNWNFYIGKQWEGVNVGEAMSKNDLPIINFIKPTIRYKVSTVAQKSMTARYSSLDANAQGLEKQKQKELCVALSKFFEKSWELSKMEKVSWKMLRASAIQGDSYAFWNTPNPSKSPLILPNTSVLLGDENTSDIQKQPYIIISERLTLDEVKKRAKDNGISKDDYENITGDADTSEQIVNTNEVDDKVTSLIYLTKVDGYVNIARTTKTLMYEKLHPIRQMNSNGEYTDNGARLYPIVSMIWEEKPNSARGVSEVEYLINNQLTINKTMLRRLMSIKLTAFPRLAYDSSGISNPEDLDNVGAKIGMNGGDARSINQMISYLQAAPISGDVKAFTDEMLNNTRNLTGAGDFATGNIDPQRASGSAIMAIRDQSQLPLNEQVAMKTQFVEDVAMLYYDMLCTYNVKDIRSEGIILPISDLQKLKPNVRIDVSDTSAWSKYVEEQKLDSLLERQYITFEEYIELMPDDVNLSKVKLKELLKERGNNIGNEQINNEVGNQAYDQSQIDQSQIDQSQIYGQNEELFGAGGTLEGNIRDGGYMA